MFVRWESEGRHSLHSYLQSAPLLVGQPVVEKNRDKKREEGFYKQVELLNGAPITILKDCAVTVATRHKGAVVRGLPVLLAYGLAAANIHKPVI